MYTSHYTVPDASTQHTDYARKLAREFNVPYVPEHVYDFDTPAMFLKYPALKQYGVEIHRLVYRVFHECDDQLKQQLPLRIDTNHLSDDQEAWFLAYLLGAVIQQLNLDTIPQFELTPEHHQLINQTMRDLFAIDVKVSVVTLANTQKVQFEFVRL